MRKEDTMKIFRLFIMLTLLSALVGCSSDAEFDKRQGEELRFVVNVGDKPGFGGETRAYADKTGWQEGDVIYMSIDNNDRLLVKITYHENSGWDTGALSGQLFGSSSGRVSAVYSDEMDKEADIILSGEDITLGGDVLYTDEGYYETADNVAYINLPMNKRPSAKIKVVGVDNGYKLNATGVTGIESFSPLTFASVDEAEAYDYESGVAVYFGVVEPDEDGRTTIRLTDPNTGLMYKRTYDKIMSAGDAVVINGPTSNESGLWLISVESVHLDKTEILLLANNMTTLKATINPANASNKEVVWTCSDESVIQLLSGENPNEVYVKGLSDGTATVTVTTVDGDKTATCDVTVTSNIEDLVKVSIGSMSVVDFNGLITASFGLKVENFLNEAIHITSIQTYNASTNELLQNAYPSDDVDVDIEGGTSGSYGITVKQVYCEEFRFVIYYTYNGNSYSSQCTVKIPD